MNEVQKQKQEIHRAIEKTIRQLRKRYDTELVEKVRQEKAEQILGVEKPE